METLILSSLWKLSLLSVAVCTPAVTADSLQGGGGGRRCHLKFTRQTPSWMSMLRESLLNSLFTSSIPPTSLTVRVTLLFFFFSSLLSLSCVPSIFLPPILFPHAWLHTCVFVYFIEAPCKHVIGEGWEEGLRACMCNAVYVEPSHLPQKSLQSPGTCSLLLFNTALCKCGCHSWSTSSENGGSLFFWYTVLLKPPLKKNTLTEKSQKNRAMTCSKASI